MQQRVEYFDNLKGVLIILVVIGHCLEKCDDNSIHWLYTFIYTFHMPLFVMTAGYFSKDIDRFKNLFKKILPYTFLYIIFQALHLIIDNDFQSVTSSILYPEYSLWFIFSLICWYFFDYFIPKKLKTENWYLPACVLISLIVGLVPVSRELSIQRTFTFLPFFMLGKLCRLKMKKSFLFIGKTTAFLLVFTIIAIISLIPFDLSAFLYGQLSLWQIARHLYSSVAIKIVFFLLTFCASVAAAALVPSMRINWLAWIGQRTLFVYLYHTLILSVSTRCLDISGPIGFACLFTINIIFLAILYNIPLMRNLVDIKKISNKFSVI